jgi:transposase
MPTIRSLVITEQEREPQRRVRAHTTPQRAAKRARVVLLAVDGLPNRQIAPMVGMREHTVGHWRRRFEAERLAGLDDRPRAGRPLVYGHDQRLRIVATVTQEPPDPASHWSHSQLAKELADMGISASQIGRILGGCSSVGSSPQSSNWSTGSWRSSPSTTAPPNRFAGPTRPPPAGCLSMPWGWCGCAGHAQDHLTMSWPCISLGWMSQWKK